MRLRTLIVLRWALLIGQLAAVLAAHFVAGYVFPWVSCLVVVAAGAVVNAWVGRTAIGARLAGQREAVGQLGFDIVQLSAILGLTGGLLNPFALLLVSPVAVAAATLPARNASVVGGLALAMLVLLYFVALPFPVRPHEAAVFPAFYEPARGLALAAGLLFTAAYAWQASEEASRMELALQATQAVLSREQRLSALGGLAAAAAHELGTPLATIQVVAKELARGTPADSPIQEDVLLLSQQADRCREILRKLSQSPNASDSHHARMSLSQLLEEVAEPYRDPVIFISTEVTCAPGADILEVKRLPEVLHGLSAFVENAADFAESAVEVIAHYDAKSVTIDIRDDGPGFPPDVIAKLGEPYVTTRSQGENSRTGHQGMGLGFFIAKTLLERTGASVQFHNHRQGGAVVTVRWPRSRMDAGPPPLGVSEIA